MRKMQHWLQNDGLVYSILAKNAYHTKTPHIKSTGFRMAMLGYSERENLPNLAELFLVNSNLKRNDPETETSIAAYLADEGARMVSLVGQEDLSAFETLSLNGGTPLDISLGDAMVRRRSVRDFTGDAITKADLATLLRASAGISARAEAPLINGDSVKFNLRTVPSGGGLQPIDLYLAALNVKGLPSGIYRYQALEDQLVVEGDKEKLNALLQSFKGAVDMVQSSNASMVVLYVAKSWRSMRKYGIRGLRFVFQEAGGMTQNLHLAVAGLGLGSVDCASCFEEEANHALGFDGIYQTLIHSVLVGTTA